jgi:hypothetical protein
MFTRVHVRARTIFTVAAAGALAASLAGLGTGAANGVNPAFSNTPLIATGQLPAGVTTSPTPNSTGNSEPAIAFGQDGKMVVDGLGWIPFQVNMWQGQFGATPSYFGAMDTALAGVGKGRLELGDEDADVEVTSAGTTLLADLDIFVNPKFNQFQLGVSVTRCPAGATGPADCTTTQLDQTNADRPWITHVGTTAYVSYHDSGASGTIRVWKSTDDGRTWKQATTPITALGNTTAATANVNQHGPIVADPTTGDVFQIFATPDKGAKGKSGFLLNNIRVARSTNGAKSWTASTVFHAPKGTHLSNLFPSMAVDSTTGTVWATWTDQHGVQVASSSNHGSTWSAPTTVSTARTTVMPWVAARDGKVDVVYYGSTAASPADTSAVWNVYDSQLTGGAWHVLQVSNTPNRVGAVCLSGSACAGNTNRELLDLFEVAEDPVNDKAAIIYTDSTLSTSTDSSGTHELPEIVLAFEN